MKTKTKECKYLVPGSENIAPRNVKAARKLIGKVVEYLYNWDVTNDEMVALRVGFVDDAYYDNIKIAGVWSRFTSVLEMKEAIHAEQ